MNTKWKTGEMEEVKKIKEQSELEWEVRGKKKKKKEREEVNDMTKMKGI